MAILETTGCQPVNAKVGMIVESLVEIGNRQVMTGTQGIIEKVDPTSVVWVSFETDNNKCTELFWCHASEVRAILN